MTPALSRQRGLASPHLFASELPCRHTSSGTARRKTFRSHGTDNTLLAQLHSRQNDRIVVATPGTSAVADGGSGSLDAKSFSLWLAEILLPRGAKTVWIFQRASMAWLFVASISRRCRYFMGPGFLADTRDSSEKVAV